MLLRFSTIFICLFSTSISEEVTKKPKVYRGSKKATLADLLQHDDGKYHPERDLIYRSNFYGLQFDNGQYKSDSSGQYVHKDVKYVHIEGPNGPGPLKYLHDDKRYKDAIYRYREMPFVNDRLEKKVVEKKRTRNEPIRRNRVQKNEVVTNVANLLTPEQFLLPPEPRSNYTENDQNNSERVDRTRKFNPHGDKREFEGNSNIGTTYSALPNPTTTQSTLATTENYYATKIYNEYANYDSSTISNSQNNQDNLDLKHDFKSESNNFDSKSSQNSTHFDSTRNSFNSNIDSNRNTFGSIQNNFGYTSNDFQSNSNQLNSKSNGFNSQPNSLNGRRNQFDSGSIGVSSDRRKIIRIHSNRRNFHNVGRNYDEDSAQFGREPHEIQRGDLNDLRVPSRRGNNVNFDLSRNQKSHIGKYHFVDQETYSNRKDNPNFESQLPENSASYVDDGKYKSQHSAPNHEVNSSNSGNSSSHRQGNFGKNSFNQRNNSNEYLDNLNQIHGNSLNNNDHSYKHQEHPIDSHEHQHNFTENLENQDIINESTYSAFKHYTNPNKNQANSDDNQNKYDNNDQPTTNDQQQYLSNHDQFSAGSNLNLNRQLIENSAEYAKQPSAQYSKNHTDQYSKEHSGQYSTESSGQYAKDNSGLYNHVTNKYKHEEGNIGPSNSEVSKYIHVRDQYSNVVGAKEATFKDIVNLNNVADQNESTEKSFNSDYRERENYNGIGNVKNKSQTKNDHESFNYAESNYGHHSKLPVHIAVHPKTNFEQPASPPNYPEDNDRNTVRIGYGNLNANHKEETKKGFLKTSGGAGIEIVRENSNNQFHQIKPKERNVEKSETHIPNNAQFDFTTTTNLLQDSQNTKPKENNEERNRTKNNQRHTLRFESSAGQGVGYGIGSNIISKSGGEKSGSILYKCNQESKDGYRFNFDTNDGIKQDEEGALQNRGTEKEAMCVTGYYTYLGPDNKEYKVYYTADEYGFRPEGEHIHSEIAQLLKNLQTGRQQ